MLTPAQWQAYKNIVNQASLSFNQDIVTWYKYTRSFQRHGEDDPSVSDHDQISLSCLMMYNDMRTWPITKVTEGGELDQQTMVMILNIQWLSDNGYLNSEGYFDMDPGMDYFIHMGIKYRAMGETPMSQAGDEPLHFYIVLEREEVPTGS